MMKKFILRGLIVHGFYVCLTVSISLAANACASGETTIQKEKISGNGLININPSVISDLHKKFGLLNQVCPGVNIHFTTGRNEDLDMIAAAGFKFIRMDFTWEKIERIKGIYDWSDYDDLTANLEKRGISAIYILDYSNSLYEKLVDSKDPATDKDQKSIAAPQHPESVAAFAMWAKASAEHFRKSSIIWEIWNEPDYFSWAPKPDVAQYIELALATCRAVKASVPDAAIIGPATSDVPLPFLESLFASGVLEYLDAVSVHPYREYSMSPETAGTDYQKVRELIDRYAPVEKREMPIISSEWGYSSSIEGVSLEKQEAYIVRMQLYNLLNGIPISIWYDWKNDGIDSSEIEHNFGTVSYHLKPKPAYNAIHTMNKQLKGFTFSRRIDVKNDNDFVMLFKNDKGDYKISAWTMIPEHPVVLDIKLTEVRSLTASDGRGNELKLKTDHGSLVLDLDALPQYITLPGGMVMN